ncbi:carboxymuconolactone decarboxylase family protein [Fusobacterium mortiferum]|uniref:Carboxymuconolactone decarboxylase family protein n=2 Tax=Fusobacterium TaxID=848 RepID=A0ABS2G3S7_FUSMR|nr:carboxymuconolactone decarboxylase family protein [Fusobacterium mortiferum]MBM6822879.1 carboxymuconolactone decarboxylase family protein [Fusobacterium mortiferum]MBM6875395.1 carboxymuconolactone decarboxylase family protein [Fusobacterium mortiferum]MBU3841377.1 carboxymuconolactone decarboxylase family protein [Candidatus Fusobacterium pullicola]
MTDREKSIVIVSVFTAKGDMIELEKSIKLALEKGVTVNEIKESMIQLYAYCGFPRSLNALGILFKIIRNILSEGR